MLKQLFKHKWYIAAILVLIIAEPSINSVLNFWLQGLFNSAKPGVDRFVILRMLTIGFLLWMSKRLVSFTTGALKARFICNVKQEVKHKIFITLLGLNTSSVSGVGSSGEYISLFTNDILLLESRFYNQVIGLISGIFSILILISSLFALNTKLAIAIALFGVISMVVPGFFAGYLNSKSYAYSNSVSAFTQKVKEYIVAYSTIKNYSAEIGILKRFDEQNKRTEDAKFDSDYALNLANNVGAMLSWFMQFIAVGFGIMLVVKGEILLGTVIAAQAFANDVGLPLQNIIMNINSIRSVKEIVTKLETMSEPKEYREESPCEDDGALPEAECEPAGSTITFEKCSLSIGEKTIVNEFSYTFEQGKKYLVVGLNGAGKSSVFKVLKKWYKLCSGKITIGGKDVELLKNSDISKYVSYLNENVSLFSGSVRDNISLFRDYEASDFESALSNAQVTLDLERQIADEGRNISSGEQRRIEIARSFLRSVKVLIFDEVVSTLDIETAYEIEKLALGLKDKTVIFVSHNFSGKLIREYDSILVMDRGSLLADGTYDELMESCPYFKRICNIKFGD